MPVTSKIIKLSGSLVFGVIIGLILLRIVWVLRDSLAWLSLALGLAAGWAAGILLAPYQSEKERFREYVKVGSAFITGYGVSKLDRLFELWVDPARGALILSQAFAHRALICISGFLLATVSTYVIRKYLSFGPGAEQPPALAADQPPGPA
jgi:energy-coupling factor transporter transmembrane protein EcfT